MILGKAIEQKEMIDFGDVLFSEIKYGVSGYLFILVDQTLVMPLRMSLLGSVYRPAAFSIHTKSI